ncbi:MAG: hypothetical protein ABFC84_10920 [Veillonellales bacterium]
MVIEVHLYNTLKRHVPSSSSGAVTVDVEDDISIAELLNEMEIEAAEIQLIMVNGKKSKLEYRLYDGDRVSLFSN